MNGTVAAGRVVVPKERSAVCPETMGSAWRPTFPCTTSYSPPLPGSEDPDPLRSKRHRSRRKRKPGRRSTLPAGNVCRRLPVVRAGRGRSFRLCRRCGRIRGRRPSTRVAGTAFAGLPPASLEEEDLEALDEAVNGNRVDLPEPGKKRGGKGGRAEAARPGKSTRPAPVAVAKQERPDEDDSPEVSAGKRVLYMSVVPEEQVEVVITDNGQVTEYFVEMAHRLKSGAISTRA